MFTPLIIATGYWPGRLPTKNATLSRREQAARTGVCSAALACGYAAGVSMAEPISLNDVGAIIRAGPISVCQFAAVQRL